VLPFLDDDAVVQEFGFRWNGFLSGLETDYLRFDPDAPGSVANQQNGAIAGFRDSVDRDHHGPRYPATHRLTGGIHSGSTKGYGGVPRTYLRPVVIIANMFNDFRCACVLLTCKSNIGHRRGQYFFSYFLAET